MTYYNDHFGPHRRKGKRKWRGFKTPVQYCPESGKVMYDKKGAATAANARRHESHERLRIYPCPACRTWHLTSVRGT